jgi:hypothetical protein
LSGVTFLYFTRNLPEKMKNTRVVAYGITSETPRMATAEQILRDNRQHWSIENSCHYILDWTFGEDRSRISKGYGPENITRLRTFAIGLLKIKGVSNVTQKSEATQFFSSFGIRLSENYWEESQLRCEPRVA